MVAIALLATACGGGTGASEDDSAAVTTTTIAPEAAPSTVAQSSVSEDDGSQPAPADVAGIGEGTATINGNTYVFGDTGFAALRCEPDIVGRFAWKLADNYALRAVWYRRKTGFTRT